MEHPIQELASLLAPHAANLCNHCLGRQFARIAPPEGNEVRGRRIRDEIGQPAPQRCSLCEDLPKRIPRWADLCVSSAAGYEYATFLVGCIVFDEIKSREEALHTRLREADVGALAANYPAKANSPGWTPGEWLKTEINREIGRNLEAATGKKVDFERPELTFRVDTRFDHVALQSADLFARGRYRKLVRDLPQTRWPCRACNGLGCRQCGGRGKTYETSVEELIAAPLVEAAQAEQEAFHGMGREDIDARMLGNGRPFILELKRPRKRSLDWTQIAARINASNIGRVEVDQLARAGPEDAARYKAADPDKNYVAVCRSETPVSRGDLEAALHRLEGAELQQRTPQRVSHRRSDLVRKRVIQRLRIVDVGEDTFTIEIRADSGTYIKEFVSGDEGRTQPSLAGTVGVPMRVTELDVIDVDWVGEEAKAPQVSPQER